MAQQNNTQANTTGKQNVQPQQPRQADMGKDGMKREAGVENQRADSSSKFSADDSERDSSSKKDVDADSRGDKSSEAKPKIERQ